MVKCYQIMENLPAVPAHFVEQALSIAKNWQANLPIHPILNSNAVVDVFKPKPFINNEGDTVIGRNTPRFRIGEDWEYWVKENISAKFTDTGTVISIPAVGSEYKDSNATSIHSDSIRKFALFYLLEQSNSDQWTRWYQEPGKPLRRPMNIKVPDISKLVEIENFCIPLKTWVFVDVGILHQGGNNIGERIAIHISFNEDVFEIFGHSENYQ